MDIMGRVLKIQTSLFYCLKIRQTAENVCFK